MHHNSTDIRNKATASPRSDAPTLRLIGLTGSVSRTLVEPILRRRDACNIACWNVRTLRDEGTQSLTMRALHQYKVDVACLSEVRLPDSGQKTIKVPGEDKLMHLYYSGVSDNSGRHGVAVVLSEHANKALLAWSPISERIAKARLKGAITNISIVAVYAPTLDSEESLKDRFYRDLQVAVDSVPTGDILIVAGDWNARTGPADDTSGHILGRFGVGSRCVNGDRLVNFAEGSRLVITNTRFQHPRRHLVTWKSNDGRTENQIDYLLVRSRWASSVLDCRAYWGADTGSANGSDHALVRATVRIRLKASQEQPRPSLFDVSKLKTAAGDAFSLELRNRFSALESTLQSVELEWDGFKSALSVSANHHLGHSRRKRRDWISAPTIALVEETRQARVSKSNDYRKLRRRTTQAVKRDRNEYWRSVAEETERAAACGDTRKLYQMLKRVSRKISSVSDTLLSCSGDPIEDFSERLARWHDHFRDLLNHAPPSAPAEPNNVAVEYECNTDLPTVEEIREVLKHLKNNKAPGEDGILPELLKSCPDIVAPWLYRVIFQVWSSESVPKDWTSAILIPVFKKGDKRLCSNYRGISLIDIAAKVFTSLLLKRFQMARDKRTRPNQSGFRPGRSCTDQIHNLRRILEQRWSYQQKTLLCFIDFAAAFDSLDRSSLWKIMEADGIPPKLLRMIQAYYHSTCTTVRVNGIESETFEVRTGVRQGCALSPTLFNYAVDWILKSALNGFSGVQVGEKVRVSDLAYADDIVLLGNSREEIQQMLNKVNQCAKAVGLCINTSKTKIMDSHPTPDAQRPITLDGIPLEEVDNFKYLGSSFLATGQGYAEISCRINQARAAFARLQPCLWARREVSITTKARVFQAVVRSILLYGSETWPVRAEDLHKLEVFDNDCLRRILRHRRVDRVPIIELRKKLKLLSIPEILVQRRLRWFGHAARRPGGEIIRDVLLPTPPSTWRKRAGGQMKTWATTLKADLARITGPTVVGLSRWKRDWLSICCDQAQDRRLWSACVRDAVNAWNASLTRPG